MPAKSRWDRECDHLYEGVRFPAHMRPGIYPRDWRLAKNNPARPEYHVHRGTSRSRQEFEETQKRHLKKKITLLLVEMGIDPKTVFPND